MDADNDTWMVITIQRFPWWRIICCALLLSLATLLVACDDQEVFKNQDNYYSIAIPEGWERQNSQFYGDIFLGPVSNGFRPSMSIHVRSYDELLYETGMSEQKIDFDKASFVDAMIDARQALWASRDFELIARGTAKVGGDNTAQDSNWIHYQYKDENGRRLEVREFFVARPVMTLKKDGQSILSAVMIHTFSFTVATGEMGLYESLITSQLQSVVFFDIK